MKVKTFEPLKQFVFASVLFVTAISIHWNFVEQKVKKDLVLQQKIQQRLQIQIGDEKVALTDEVEKTAQL